MKKILMLLLCIASLGLVGCKHNEDLSMKLIESYVDQDGWGCFIVSYKGKYQIPYFALNDNSVNDNIFYLTKDINEDKVIGIEYEDYSIGFEKKENVIAYEYSNDNDDLIFELEKTGPEEKFIKEIKSTYYQAFAKEYSTEAPDEIINVPDNENSIAIIKDNDKYQLGWGSYIYNAEKKDGATIEDKSGILYKYNTIDSEWEEYNYWCIISYEGKKYYILNLEKPIY